MTAETGCSAKSTFVSPKASPLKQEGHKSNNCKNGKMGKGKRQVNIKKSYEKARETCKIHTISHKFCKK